MYKERNKQKRKEFIRQIKKKEERDLIFVDESGINHQYEKEYCWVLKGENI
ncbi:hypothetical protein AGMMS49990_03130 [Endomicrobiia bacterium]|nr:hypothetical protein AGMMS49990_03130 [Endomicrobiia bacterium]